MEHFNRAECLPNAISSIPRLLIQMVVGKIERVQLGRRLIALRFRGLERSDLDFFVVAFYQIRRDYCGIPDDILEPVAGIDMLVPGRVCWGRLW